MVYSGPINNNYNIGVLYTKFIKIKGFPSTIDKFIPLSNSLSKSTLSVVNGLNHNYCPVIFNND